MTHFIAILDHQPHEDRTRYRVFRIKRSVPIELGYTEYTQHHLLTQFDREQKLREQIYDVITQHDADHNTRNREDLEELVRENKLSIHLIE